MTARFLATVVCLALALTACERQPGPSPASAPATAQSAATSTQSAASASQPATAGVLHDYVRTPLIDAAEQTPSELRILSTAPNVTEICCALGLRGQLVGRTRYCTYPPEVAAVPSIGDLYNLNAEALLALRPELILIAGQSRSVSERLDRLGLRYESLPDVSLEDVFTSITLCGGRTGRPRTAAALVAALRGDLDRVAAQYAGVRPARVLLLTGPLSNPPTQADAAGPGSFYDDLLRRAGHVNVAAASGRAFAPLSLEFVLTADPDVIIELAPDATARPAGDADARAAWRRVGPLRAVERGRVHVLVGPEHFLLGPRLPQTFAALCELIARGADD